MKKQQMHKPLKIIISGGGTGGHVFPAISIANAIKEKNPDADILFVGASGKIEMDKVPKAGYKIEGLPVKGFNRKNIFKNISVLMNLLKSIIKANRIIKQFKPDVVVGVGGYASGPVLFRANREGIPTLLQEQNSYAGVTNRLLSKKAKKVCVAYDGMEKYFPGEKIVLAGNPVRKDIKSNLLKQGQFLNFYGFDKNVKTILILGGSLGARTINNSILRSINVLLEYGYQVIWQTGKYYYKKIIELTGHLKTSRLKIADFIAEMDMAYAVADIIVSRAGAGTISELCIIGKPVILVPSPNVAEDHQTKNAMALVGKNAALMVKDSEAGEKLVNQIVELLSDEDLQEKLAGNIKKLAMPNSAGIIADEIIKLSKVCQ